jgi:flagellin-like hook-associated protein FlgL
MLIDPTAAAEAALTSLLYGSPATAKPMPPVAQSQATEASQDTNASRPSASSASQINSLTATQSSLGDAMSFSQTQDAYLQSVGTALSQMGQMASAAQDPSASDADIAQLNGQFQSLAGHIHGMGHHDFNGVSLFSASPVTVASGADNQAALSMPGIDLNSAPYSAATSASLVSGGAAGASDAVTAALNQVASDRVSIGSFQAGIEQASSQLSGNLDELASFPPITDAAGADAAMNSILSGLPSQAGALFAAQTHQTPQEAARLLQ